MMSEQTFRAGDIVNHRPSGEEWLVAAVSADGRELIPAGWPETQAKAADCALVEAASDKQHIRELLEVVKIGRQEDMRLRWSLATLIALHPEDKRALIDQLRQTVCEAELNLSRAEKTLDEALYYVRVGDWLDGAGRDS